MEELQAAFLKYVLPAIITGLIALLTAVGKAVLNYVQMKRKQLAHETGNHIVEESILIAVDGMGSEFVKAMADGKISDAEKVKLKDTAKTIAEERLKRVYGFYKKDLKKWIDERIDSALPKVARSEAHRFVSKHL